MWVCVYCDFVNGLFACGFDVSAFAYYGLVVGVNCYFVVWVVVLR